MGAAAQHAEHRPVASDRLAQYREKNSRSTASMQRSTDAQSMNSTLNLFRSRLTLYALESQDMLRTNMGKAVTCPRGGHSWRGAAQSRAEGATRAA